MLGPRGLAEGRGRVKRERIPYGLERGEGESGFLGASPKVAVGTESKGYGSLFWKPEVGKKKLTYSTSGPW